MRLSSLFTPILSASLLAVLPNRMLGCDACGCGPASGLLTGQPLFGRGAVSLHTSFQNSSDERVWGHAVTGSIPVFKNTLALLQFNYQHSQYVGLDEQGLESSYSAGGLGDFGLGGLHRKHFKSGSYTVQGTIFLPTGVSTLRTEAGQLHATVFQPGNGAPGLRGGFSVLWGKPQAGISTESQAEFWRRNTYGNQKPGQWALGLSLYRANDGKSDKIARVAAGISYNGTSPAWESGTAYGKTTHRLSASISGQLGFKDFLLFAHWRPTLFQWGNQNSLNHTALAVGFRIPIGSPRV